ncbi:MAG: sugar ABC transporter substrate-binding protein [Firmicutes bacterium]|nr:sugar ABC transporter substrate-binding protein [Bacillota bacterium]
MMEKTRKSTRRLILLALFVMALGLCMVARGATQVTITYMNWDPDMTAKFIAAWDKLNTGIKVVSVPSDDNKLKAMIAAGNPPDLMMSSIGGALELIRAGAIEPLDKYIAAGNVLKKAELMPINDLWKTNDGLTVGKGKRYGLLADFGTTSWIIYNKGLFDKAGIPYPDPFKPMTADQFRTLAKKLTVRDSNGRVIQYGCTIMDGQLQLIPPLFLHQKGLRVWSKDFKKINLDHPEFKKICQWMLDMALQDHSWNSPADPSTNWDGGLFISGQVAMVLGRGRWLVPFTQMNANPKIDLGVAPAPMWGSKRVALVGESNGYVMFSAGKHKKEAFRFLAFLATGEPAKERARIGWNNPAIKSLYSLLPNSTPFEKQLQQLQDEELKYVDYSEFLNPYYPSDALWGDLRDDLFAGKVSLDECLAASKKRIEQIIADRLEQLGE